MNKHVSNTETGETTPPVALPVRINNPSLADELRGGEDIESWVAELRRSYPQYPTGKVISTD